MLLLRGRRRVLMLETNDSLNPKKDARDWAAVLLSKMERALALHLLVPAKGGGRMRRLGAEVVLPRLLVEEVGMLVVEEDEQIVVVRVLKQLAQMSLRR